MAMYYRRKILLNLIAAFGKQGVSKIKLQKLLFLLCQEQPFFDFVPYKFGCYSFQATQDLSVLGRYYQLIADKGNKWVAQFESPALKPEEARLIDSLVRKFKRYDEIVHYVYERFPYYTIYSEWKDMTAEQKHRKQQEQQTIKAKNQECLFTVGYEGKSIDNYLNELVKNNIGLLCDVRRNPVSMKYGFSKSQLERYCDKLKIIYVHTPELGIASQKRKNLNSEQDYQNLFESYKRKLPNKTNGLEQLLNLLQKHKRIAITCFEKLPHQCHRHCISDYLKTQNNITCEHL